MGGLCGDGNGVQLEGKQGADLASTQGVESWFGGWVHEGLADLDEAVLAPIGAGEGWIDGMGCSSVYCWIEVAIQGASGLANSICVWGRSKVQNRSLPVMVRPCVANVDHWELMGTLFSEAFLSFSLLLRFVCVFSYFPWHWKFSPGWMVSTDQLEGVCANGGGPAVVILSVSWRCRNTDQLGWVCDGPMVVIRSVIGPCIGTDQSEWVYDGSAVVILPVRWCWIPCQHDTMSHSLHGVSAVYAFHFSSLSLFSWFVFPCYAYPRWVKLIFCTGWCTWGALSAIKMWHVIIKWLLPPGVKMKSRFCWLGGSFLILISFVRLGESLRGPKFDIAFSLYFISISVDGFRQDTCYLYKLNGASCLSMDQFSLHVFKLSGLYWCSLSISIASGMRWNFWLSKWKLPPSGKMKCVDGISVRQHRRKVILSDLLFHSGGFSLLVCRHYIQAIEGAICALLAVWCLLEYFVVFETFDFISICSHCNMGFRLYVPPLYSAVSLIDGF